MKSLSTAMNSHLEGEVLTLATCWALTRQDGTELFFTDFDEDLVVGGDTYLAASGYSRSAIANSSSFTVDNLDIIGNLQSDIISEADLFSGLYDYAEVRIFMVNWQDLSMGTIPLRKGWLGEIYAPLCSADLGDTKCGVDVEALTETDSVASVTSRGIFTLTSYNGAEGVLTGGVLTFTSGANAGRSAEIRNWVQADKTVTLYLEMPFEIAEGDAVSFFPGCDKRYATCRDTYSNHLNFRGFPHIPGTDALLESGND
mgnify:CR=1 FL=1